jgi:hypothetical protein
MNTQTQPAQRKLLFENSTCTRCGGGGRMPYSVYGGVCFKCHGRGATLTKRGRAAQAWLNSQREKPLEQFVSGDIIFAEGVDCIGKRGEFHRVISVKFLDGKDAGYPHLPEIKCVRVTCERYEITGFLHQPRICRFGMTGPQKDDLRARALAYQSTLTKSGTVAKRPAKSAAALVGEGEPALAQPQKIAA